MNKPKIFIGSSVEGLDVANAIQENLEFDAEVTIWNQGVFQLSIPTITNLLNALQIYDFAIFVFSPSDITKMHNQEFKTIRDNVVFETGLFAGKLGLERVYFIKPRGEINLHLPTDLLGLTAGEYDSNRSDRNLVSATAVFSNQVRKNIKDLGVFAIQNNIETIVDFNNMENDLTILFTYLKEKGWKSMSFAKIKENVHPKLTEDWLMKIIENYPKAIRRCRLKEGVYGIKWIQD